MISMKIMYCDEKIIIYLYNRKLDIDNKDMLYKEIKEIFVNLIKKKNLNFFGSFKVDIFHNEIYGSFLEINKLYDGFNISIIDLKISLFKNAFMQLEFDDNYLNDTRLKYKDGKYYLNISDANDLIKYIEYGKIIYYKNSFFFKIN